MLKMPPRNEMTLDKDEQEFFTESCEYNQALGWNAALDEVTRLNKDRVEGLVRALEKAQKVLSNHWFTLKDGEEYNNDDVIEADTLCQVALQSFREEK